MPAIPAVELKGCLCAGANAGRAITRTSSLIKTRVTKDLLSLPSTPPLHQVLVGADSIMGRCTLDHFSGDGKAEDEEQSAQPFAALPPAPLAPDDSEAGDEGQSAQPAAALPSASLPLAPLPPGGNKAGDEGQSAQPAVPLRSAPLPPAKTYTHPSLMPSHPFIPLSPPMHPSLVVHMDFQQQRRKLAVAEAVQVQLTCAFLGDNRFACNAKGIWMDTCHCSVYACQQRA